MITDTVFAYQVENNDYLVIDDVVAGYVYSVDEEGDYVHLDTVDDEGEHTTYAFGPFDVLTLFLGEEDESAVSTMSDETLANLFETE